MKDWMINIAEEISDEIIEIRRMLHKYPELAFCENHTHDYICSYLEQIEGLTIQKNAANGTGIIATLEGKAGPGKNILFRADLDALPISEEVEWEFRSEREGCMHACGHDAHVWPELPKGKVGIPTRYAFGAPGRFKINILGKGGHGASPENTIDPIAIGNEFYQKIPALLSRKMKGTDSKLVSVTYMLAGKREALSIIPNTCELGGTMRAVSLEIMQKMESLMEQELRTICEANGATYEIEFMHDLDSVKNQSELIVPIQKIVERSVGTENTVLVEDDNLVGEDFSVISTKVPSVYLLFGIGEEHHVPVLHNSKFYFDDRRLVTMSKIFAEIVMEYSR